MEFEKIIENFPFIMQCNEWSCGPSITQAMLLFYGDFILQEELIKKLNCNETNGTDFEDIEKLFIEREFNTELKELTIDCIKHYLNKNIPVIIEIQAWGNDNEYHLNSNSHFIILIGYCQDGFLCEDPYIENRGFLPFKDLDKKWHSKSSKSDKIFYKTGLIIQRKENKFSFDKIIYIK